MAVYFMLYYPVSTMIEISKSSNQIEVTYKMLCCGRYIYRNEAIENIKDIVVSPVKSQYGIVGYVANISFQNGA